MDASLRIEPIRFTLRPFRGPDQIVEAGSSLELFNVLDRCARRALRVVEMNQGNRQLDASSRAALNCYLRTYRIRRGAALPFYRSTELIARTRWLWEMFGRYLDFTWISDDAPKP